MQSVDSGDASSTGKLYDLADSDSAYQLADSEHTETPADSEVETQLAGNVVLSLNQLQDFFRALTDEHQDTKPLVLKFLDSTGIDPKIKSSLIECIGSRSK